jgi:hypothetical protein
LDIVPKRRKSFFDFWALFSFSTPDKEPFSGGCTMETQERSGARGHLGKDSTPAALIVQWRELAEMLRAEGCPEVAAARERCASELETSLHKHDNEALSVNQAASESGYSAEYLRRLLRDTPALNAGRTGKPLILRRDLPRKLAAALVGSGPKPYDVNADAQSLVSRQGAH